MESEWEKSCKEFKILYDSAKTNTSHKFIVIRNGISRSVEGDLGMLSNPNTEMSEVHDALRFWIDYITSHPEQDEINALKRGLMKQERTIFNLKSKIRDRNRMVNNLEHSVRLFERVFRDLPPVGQSGIARKSIGAPMVIAPMVMRHPFADARALTYQQPPQFRHTHSGFGEGVSLDETRGPHKVRMYYTNKNARR